MQNIVINIGLPDVKKHNPEVNNLLVKVLRAKKEERMKKKKFMGESAMEDPKSLKIKHYLPNVKLHEKSGGKRRAGQKAV